MIVNLGSAGQFGLVRDRPFEGLPMNAFTRVRNMTFRDGVARRVQGYTNAYTPSIAPYNAFFVNVPAGPFWVYPGLVDIYATDGSTHSKINKAVTTYNATADLNWTGGMFGGLLLLNNGIDAVPQVWTAGGVSTLLVDLANWPASTSCRVLRPFKSYLVALDITESGTRYPHLLRWSHPADPGTVPSSWDYTDPTKDAGRTENPFRETNDFFVDCAPLRDNNIIYKETSTWGMQRSFDEFIFRFYKIFDSIGLMSRRCAVEFFAGQHFTVALDDILVHDGQQATSVLTTRMRNAIFNEIDATKYVRNFVLVDWASNTVLFFYVPTGSDFCTRVLMWNFRENTLSLRDVDAIAGGGVGQVAFSSIPLTWDSDAESWDSDTTVWDFSAANPRDRRLLLAGVAKTKLYGYPQGLSLDGTSFTSTLERTRLGVPPREGSPPDYSSVKQLRRIFPHVSGTSGQQVDVYVGAQDSVEEAVVWQGPYTFTIGTSEWIDCIATGRLLAYKLESVEAFDWALSSVDVDIRFRGHQ
jgi:hypothetical protein